jgi:hypothetical protein
MRTLNFLVFLTVILNACILIGAGHGIGVLFIYEILSFRFIFVDDVNILGSYAERLVPIAFISCICQILLLISLITKPWKLRKIFINSFCLLVVFLLLIKDFPESSSDQLSLTGGIPFLISSIFLLIKVNFTIRE